MTVALTQILLVEDSPADIRLTQEALKDAKVVNDLHIARDGAEALEFLRHEGRHAGSPRPHLVILDLNIPRVSGREVLAEMKSDPQLRSIPVAVLTTSAQEADIVAAYDTGANCYLTKPIDLDQFLHLVRSLEHFWLGIVTLPPAHQE